MAPKKRTPPVPELIALLEKTYPDAHCELEHSNPLELLMATILSAQCTDARVNQVTRVLFQRCPTALSYAEIPLAELEKIVKTTGFFRAKARHLQACAQALLEKHGGQVPRSLEALTALPGVGRKTANVVLGDAFGTPAGIVVDTHVQRLSQRLGLSPHSDPLKIEADLLQRIPPALWARFSHLLIWHGRRRCDARKPDCAQCELNTLCPSASADAHRIGRKIAPRVRVTKKSTPQRKTKKSASSKKRPDTTSNPTRKAAL